ncbi:hypothetical protein ACHAXH_000782 [Discostella pseudostelligera]
MHPSLPSNNILHEFNQHDNLHHHRGRQFITATLPSFSSSASTPPTAAVALLTPEQRATLLRKLIEPNNTNANNSTIGKWKLLHPSTTRNAITKTFHFIDFQQAWNFMTKVSILAEQMNHHPEWNNVYNRVELTVDEVRSHVNISFSDTHHYFQLSPSACLEPSTHDCNGLSTNDIEMATKMDEYELELLSGRPPTIMQSKE